MVFILPKKTAVCKSPTDSKISTIPAYLDSILLNLLSNAIKYGVTPTSKFINIDVRQYEGKTIFKVQDGGVGIDLEAYGDRLFQLGSRLHTFSQGQGIGLFMVKRQVEALEGSIEVESKPYQGTTFTVTL